MRRNWTNVPDPPLPPGSYEGFNFNQMVPIEVAGKKRGVRLFPAHDGTGYTFIDCAMSNAEPPPNAVTIDCRCALFEHGVLLGTETITIDGQSIVHEIRGTRVYGTFDFETRSYVDFPTAQDQED